MALVQETEINEVAHRRKTEAIAVYIRKEIKEELEQWAGEDDRSVSYLVARLIEKALEERRSNKSKQKE